MGLNKKHGLNPDAFEVKKVGVTEHKTSSVFGTYFCQNCPKSETHQTGSLLWVSCRFVPGWRSINSVCVLPVEKQKELLE